MYGFFCDIESVYIMMEYMEEGSLYYQVRLAKKFTEVEAGAKLLEVCQAVNYLHSLDILHRDIKPENIVISNVLILEFRESASFVTSAGLPTAAIAEILTVEPWTMCVLKSYKVNLMIILWTFGQ